MEANTESRNRQSANTATGFMTKVTLQYNRGKDGFFNKWGQLDSIWKTILLFLPHIVLKKSSLDDFRFKYKRQNNNASSWENIFTNGASRFFNRSQKTLTIKKRKMNILDFSKIKNLCPSKNNIESEKARHKMR